MLSIRHNARHRAGATVMQGAERRLRLCHQARRHGPSGAPCELASQQDGLAVIAKGLAAGEKVVVDGQYRLTDGVKVKIDAPRRSRSQPAGSRADPAMNISETFIRRPIATSLLMAGILVFGVATYKLLPVAALPNVDFPTITVSATLPGASPDTMASSVATPLEQQFAAIPGLAQMTSTSGLGTTSITLQFDLNRNIDGAAQRRADRDQRGERPAAQGPAHAADLPKINPADRPILIYAVSFRRHADLQGRRLRLHDPGAEDLDGDRRVAGRSSPASRNTPCTCRSTRPRSPRAASGSRTCAPRSPPPRSTSPRATSRASTSRSRSTPTTSCSTPRPIENVIVAYRNGAPVRVKDIGEVIDRRPSRRAPAPGTTASAPSCC